MAQDADMTRRMAEAMRGLGTHFILIGLDVAEAAAHVRRLQELADHVAACETDDELEGDMSGDDAVDTLGSLVDLARRVSERRPDIAGRKEAEAESMQDRAARLTFVHRPPEPHPDDYPFTAPPSPPGMITCPNCNGDGEVIDFPNETDERMVCCPTCGGQGEVVDLSTPTTEGTPE